MRACVDEDLSWPPPVVSGKGDEKGKKALAEYLEKYHKLHF